MKATILFKLADQQYEEAAIKDLTDAMKEKGYKVHRDPHYISFHKGAKNEKEKTT